MNHEPQRNKRYSNQRSGHANFNRQGPKSSPNHHSTTQRKEEGKQKKATSKQEIQKLQLAAIAPIQKVLTRRDISKIETNGASTSPTSFQAVQLYVGTTATRSEILNLILDLIVADMVGETPSIVDTKQAGADTTKISPVTIKAYLFWATMDHIREVGLLKGTYAYQLVKFPKNLLIPKALARYLWYYGKYHYEGAEYQVATTLDAAPVWNSDGILDVAANLALSYTGTYRVAQYKANGTTGEMEQDYNTTVTSCDTFANMIAISSNISQRIGATGFGIEYERIPKNAPDASAYAVVIPTSTQYNDCVVSFHSDDFDADMASILGTNVATTYDNTGYPFVKSPRACVIEQPTGIADLYGSDARARGFVFVVNRMQNPLEKGWNYAGYELNSFVPQYKSIESGPIWGLIHMCIARIQQAKDGYDGTSFTAQTVAAALAVLSGGLFRKMGAFRPKAMGLYWQSWMPPKAYDSIRFPVPLAAVVEEIGPVIQKKQLIVPYLLQSEEIPASSYSDNNSNVDWFAFIAASVAPVTPYTSTAYNFWARNLMKSSVTVNFSFNGSTINAAWLVASPSRVCFPWVYFSDVYEKYNLMLEIPEFIDFFVAITGNEFGTISNLSDSIYATDTFGDPVTLANDVGTAAFTWNFAIFPKKIASSVPLTGRDLVMALIINSSRDDESLLNVFPHSVLLGSSSNVAMNVISTFVKGLATPGGSAVVALGDERMKQTSEVVKVGSVTLNKVDPGQCRSYWCSIADQTMSAASAALALDSDGGSRYMAPKAAKEILANAGKYVYQQTVGELKQVAVEGGKKLLNGMVQNAIPMLLEAIAL